MSPLTAKRLSAVLVALLSLVLFAAICFVRPKEGPVWKADCDLVARWSTNSNAESAFTSLVTITALVTNKNTYRIRLLPVQIEYEDRAGAVTKDLDHLWNDNYDVFLPPGSVAGLEFDVPLDTKRVRLIATYARQWGAIRQALGRGVSKLPLRYLPPRSYTWLRKNGLVDPPYSFVKASAWMLNPAVQRTEASHSADVLNEPLSEAGFGR
jgi:hypothetical protein